MKVNSVILEYKNEIIIESEGPEKAKKVKICSKKDKIWQTVGNKTDMASAALYTYVACN